MARNYDALRVHKENFVQCRECAEPMCGILDVKIREICTPCGGVSLIAEERRLQRLEREKRLTETRYRQKIL